MDSSSESSPESIWLTMASRSARSSSNFLGLGSAISVLNRSVNQNHALLRQAAPGRLSFTPGGESTQPSPAEPDIEFIADLNPRGLPNCPAIAGVDHNRIAAFEDTQRRHRIQLMAIGGKPRPFIFE